MLGGKIPQKPTGFGSSSSRFPKGSKDSTPGPGSYDPKTVRKEVQGGSFSKAERFNQKVEDDHFRSQIHIEELPVQQDTQDVSTPDSKQQVQVNESKSSNLGASPELVPEDESYQHLSKLRDQGRQEHKSQKTPLEDGRKVMILGGLERDVQILDTLFNESPEAHMNGLNKMHKELLGEVTKELKMLVGNIDLETDGFASKEVEVVQSLFKILENTQSQLQKHGLGQNEVDMDEARQFLTQLGGQYTDATDIVQIQFDGTKESLDRMARALSSKDTVQIFDSNVEEAPQTMTKEKFLQDKQFHIKRPSVGTPLLSEFKALFPESQENVYYK